jgi:uncharacterized protein (TIGR03083 family)
MSLDTTSPKAAELLDALRASHERLAAIVAGLSDEDVTAQSYDDDWSIAQVLSHLGSGAQIFGRYVQAGAEGTAVPGIDDIRPIWDAWNAKAPRAQADDALRADGDFLALVEGLTDDERSTWRLDMFGEVRDLADVLRMRLAEHALHTWDVAVAFDPAATVDVDAVGLIIDNLDALVARVGKPVGDPRLVAVTTDAPQRSYDLALGTDGAVLSRRGGAPSDGELTGPAEAFVRLLYGRLDPDHTPPLRVTGIGLDELRAVFPGV